MSCYFVILQIEITSGERAGFIKHHLFDILEQFKTGGIAEQNSGFRALAHGHMTFFEWAVAELAGVPHHRTWLMIHDAGPLGLKAICERAGLPPRLYSAFRAGVDAFHGLEFDGGANDRERFQEHMIQRFLTSSHTVSREDSEYLLERMDRSANRRRSDRDKDQGAA